MQLTEIELNDIIAEARKPLEEENARLRQELDNAETELAERCSHCQIVAWLAHRLFDTPPPASPWQPSDTR